MNQITDYDLYRIEGRIKGVYYRKPTDCTVRVGDKLEARRYPDNEYDSNAIGLHGQDGSQIGWVSRGLAEDLAPLIDAGKWLNVCVTTVEGTNIWADYTGGAVTTLLSIREERFIALQRSLNQRQPVVKYNHDDHDLDNDLPF